MEGIGGGGGGGIYRLPEECVSQVISRTSPRDSCRCSAVSTAIHAAADSDAVWSRFLPPDLPSILSRAVDPPPESITKKDLFFTLCDRPILIDGGKMSFALDRLSNGKCYMLSARSLSITWGEAPQYWRWISHPDSRFAEVAKLLDVCWFDIRGKIESKLLSQNTTYAAYLIFKMSTNNYGLNYPPQETTVSLGAHVSTHTICLVPDDDDEEALDYEEEVPSDDEEADWLRAFDSTRNFFLWPNVDEEAPDDEEEEAPDDEEEEAPDDDKEAERLGTFDSTRNFFLWPNDDEEAPNNEEEVLDDNEEMMPDNEEEALDSIEETADNNQEAPDNDVDAEEGTMINVRYPQKRDDGWMEIGMGEFHNEEGEDGEVEMSLMEIKGGHWKSGLILQGIEVRPKN